MTVSFIGESKIKVRLTAEEGLRLFGETEYWSLDNPSIKNALRTILRKVKYETLFLRDCSIIYVDLYKVGSVGFIVYLTKGKDKKAYKNTFSFKNVDNMLDALSSIKRITSNYRVFAHLDRFYLQIADDSLDLSPHIEEFCDKSAI